MRLLPQRKGPLASWTAKFDLTLSLGETADGIEHQPNIPTEELNDYARAFPDQEEAIDATVSYFSAAAHAPAVNATTPCVGLSGRPDRGRRRN